MTEEKVTPEMRKERFVELVKVGAIYYARNDMSPLVRAFKAMEMVNHAINIPADRIPTDQTSHMSAQQFVERCVTAGRPPDWAGFS